MDDATDRPTGPPMDGDPVLRALAADLARDDPRLAALLGGDHPTPSRTGRRILLALLLVTPVLALALVRAPTVTVGILGLVLALASPLAAWWLSAVDRPGPRQG